MDTILTPCLVPWAISPSTSGVTLSHSEDSAEPECTVVFGAGRMQENGLTDSRRIEILFELCYYARVGPHGDSEGIEVLGYQIDGPICDPRINYLDWRRKLWRETGTCPDSGFYVAKQSS